VIFLYEILTFILLYFNILYILKPHKSLETFLYIFNIIFMTKEEKKIKIESLKIQAVQLKKDVEYYNAMQTALKLVLNGSYA